MFLDLNAGPPGRETLREVGAATSEVSKEAGASLKEPVRTKGERAARESRVVQRHECARARGHVIEPRRTP